MELLTRHIVAILLLLSTLQLASCQGQACMFDPSTDLNATAFYLESNATRFRYPDHAGKLSLGGDDAGLRIVCPAGTIMVNARPTSLSSSNIDCVGGATVKLSGSFFYSPLSLISCTGEPVAAMQLTGKKTNDGKNIAEIGYKMGLINFLPVVDELVVNSFKGGYTPRWAHFKALPVKAADMNSTTKASLKTSPLSAKVSFETVYDVVQQRTQFMTLFNDTPLVDKYMPADGNQAFVPAMLISNEDLYYENQRTSVRFYETTVPVWKSIASGNWKRVGEAARQIAAESLTSDVDVWSGSYLQLWLTNAQNKTTYIELPDGIKPAQFLFKYVHDASSKRGLVFVTVNNPHLTQADKKNVICDELPSCKIQFPEFSDFAKGYTYCCSLEAFKSQAKTLGLPVFEDTTQIVF